MFACQNSECRRKKAEFMCNCESDSYFCSTHLIVHLKKEGNHEAKSISDVADEIKIEILGCLETIRNAENEMLTEANKYMFIILQKLKELQSVVNTEKKKLIEKLENIDIRKSVSDELEIIKMSVLSYTKNFNDIFFYKKYGILQLENGIFYEGETLNNKAQGKGLCKFKSGNIYKGDWIDNKQQGKGVFKWANGDVYDGEWVNNKKHGKGIYRYKNGSVYDGGWIDDKKQGKGVFRFSNGDIYEGDWIDGKFQGKAILRYNNGEVFEGYWLNDLKHGKFQHKLITGEMRNEVWECGVKRS